MRLVAELEGKSFYTSKLVGAGRKEPSPGGRLTVQTGLVPRSGSCPTNTMLTTTKMRLL
jgi:hypothetical protein